MEVQAAGSGGSWETFPEGVIVYPRIHATVTDPDLPVESLEVDLELDGERYRCTGLRCVDSNGLTGAELRQIPVARVVAVVVEHAIAMLPKDPKYQLGWSYLKTVPGLVERLEGLPGAWKGGAPPRPELPRGRAGPNERLLAYVAWRYRVGLLIGDAPTEYVAADLGAPRATVGRWIALARERGFLLAPPPRRPD